MSSGGHGTDVPTGRIHPSYGTDVPTRPTPAMTCAPIRRELDAYPGLDGIPHLLNHRGSFELQVGKRFGSRSTVGDACSGQLLNGRILEDIIFSHLLLMRA